LNLVRRFLLLIMLTAMCGDLLSQELQPRRWAALPVGVNFVALGTLWTYGDILFDPALLIEDAEVEILGVGAGYIRTFEMFGKQARIDAALPYANGRWSGLLDGEPASVRRHGFADARLRLSVNLLGSPPLKMREFAGFQAQNPAYTTVGAAVGVTVPTGEYRSDRLINLGENRWVIRPELGVLHQHHNWQFEVTGSVFLAMPSTPSGRGCGPACPAVTRRAAAPKSAAPSRRTTAGYATGSSPSVCRSIGARA
jgi:hypothetical protein